VYANTGANADAHSVFVMNGSGESFIYTNTSNTCLNLAGSTGITFYASGSGTLKVATAGPGVTDPRTKTFTALTSGFMQYTLLWSDIGGPPRLSNAAGAQVNLVFFATGATTTTATSLGLDNIVFTK
jgi:hypothetical protein